MVPKIADGPKKRKIDRFWDDFENDDWDEDDDFNNEGDWEEYEEE